MNRSDAGLPRRLAAALLSLLLVGIAAPAATAAKAVALVDGCQGTAFVLSAGRRPLYLGDQLFAGDRVALSPGTVLTVAFFGDGHREQVQGPGQVTVVAAGLRGSGVDQLPPDTNVALLPASKRTMLDYIPMGDATRNGGGELLLRYPSGPASTPSHSASLIVIPSNRPEIRWVNRGEPGSVDVTLYHRGAAGEPQQLWKRSTSADRLPYPPDVDPLAPGTTYMVAVRVAGSDDPDQQSTADFTVASAAEAKALAAADRRFQTARSKEPTDPTPYTRMALFYLDHRALADAATVMEICEASVPDEPGPHRFLLAYYQWMGWNGAADYEQKMLRRLGVRLPDQGRPQTMNPPQ